MKRVFKPLSLDKPFDEAITRFRNHKKTVEKEAETSHMIEEAEERALVLRNRQLQEIERKSKASLASGVLGSAGTI
jgi:hypothetical protein